MGQTVRQTMIAVMLFLPAMAVAEPQVRRTISEYAVSGKDGAAIMRQIRRKGPSHGMIGRAIAETRYVLDFGYEVQQSQGRCHIANPWVRLEITILFPRLDGDVSLDLRQRWEHFLAGARQHEEEHAK